MNRKIKKMRSSSEKEKVLKLLRDAQLERDNSAEQLGEAAQPLYKISKQDMITVFAEKFSEGNGKFFYCRTGQELVASLKNLIEYRQWKNVVSFSENLQSYLAGIGLQTNIDDEHTTVGITLCHALMARTGSIIITSEQGVGTHLKRFTPILIVIAFASQLCDDYGIILDTLDQKRPQWVLNIKSGDLVQEEIREMYMFLMDA